MPKLPLPPLPADLALIPPDLMTLEPHVLLWRIYKRSGRYPTRWRVFRDSGPLPSGRFDHHRPAADGIPCRQSRAILYVATDILTCVAEVFQEDRVVDRERDSPWLAAFALANPVLLLTLRNLWPVTVGASALLNADERRDLTHAWSAAIYTAYPRLSGIAYNAAMTGQPAAYALYEQAQTAMPARPLFNRSLRDPSLTVMLAACADRLRYDFR